LPGLNQAARCGMDLIVLSAFIFQFFLFVYALQQLCLRKPNRVFSNRIYAACIFNKFLKAAGKNCKLFFRKKIVLNLFHFIKIIFHA
jgi:hypothetical protein